MKVSLFRAIAGLAVLVTAPLLRGSYDYYWYGPTQVQPFTDYDIYPAVQFNPANSQTDPAFSFTYYRNQTGADQVIYGGGGPAYQWIYGSNAYPFNDGSGQTIHYRVEAASYQGETGINYRDVQILGAVSYGLTVSFGDVVPTPGPGARDAIDGWYAEGTTVSIAGLSPHPAYPSQIFDHWEHVSGPGTITNANAAQSSFIMGAGHATITVVYKQPRTLTVQNGTGGGSYYVGDVVNVSANAPPSSQVFTAWSHVSGPGSLANASATQTTFTMGDGDSTVSASYGTAPPAPTITQQPTDRSLVVGQSFSVYVFVTGATPFSFQWRKNGSQIPGATSSTYFIGSAEQSDAGTYTVVVSNASGSVTSAPATVTVDTPENLAWGTITPGSDPGTPAASPGVGTLTANVSVDNKGSANGSIPLKIPPGRSGLQPSLSLNYNSAGGNGPLGTGWSLSTGFPQAITRGRSILARDGEVRGVTFTSTDKFYLDGKRLIAVSGTYGVPGSAYRTEVDSFVTITTTDTNADSVIDTFTVTDKSGTEMIFGKHAGTTDGYQMGGGAGQTLAYSYALKQVKDTLGNTLTFNYSEVINTAGLRHGEYVLSEILYGGGPARVTFHYNFKTVAGNTERLDRTTSYVAGKVFAQSRRLDGINVEFEGTRTGYYALNYDYAPNGGPLRLTSVTPYLRDGTGSGFTSFAPTTLTWSASTQNYTTQVSNGFFPAGPVSQAVENWGYYWATTEYHAFADVNGDGLDDLVDTRTAPIKVSLANGVGGFSVPADWTDPGVWAGAAVLMRLADINGDGRKDIVFGRTFSAGGKLYALVSNGTKFVPLSGSGSTPTEIYTFSNEFADSTPNTDYLILKDEQNGVTGRFATADFTGDGCDDILIHRYDGLLKLIRWNGSGFDTGLAPANVGAEPLINEDPWIIDPNQPQTPLVWLGLRYRMKFSIRMIPCELNGDGISDYAWVHTEHKWDTQDNGGFGSSVVAYVGKIAHAVTGQPGGGFSARTTLFGTGTVASSNSTNYYRNGQGQLMVGDVNGDGLTDFLTIQPADLETYSGGERRVMQPALLLSRGSSGQPSFQYYESAGITPNVSLNGTTVNPYFDPLSHATWSSNYFGSIGSMPSTLTGLFFSFGLSSSGDNMYLQDVNQDGRQDYLWYVDEPSSVAGWWVMYSQGTSFAAPVSVPAAQIPWTPTVKYSGMAASRNLSTRQALQLNGDGVADYAAAIVDSGSTPGVDFFHISNGKPGHRLTALTDGLGRRTDIDYKPITDNSIYTPGAAVSYPIREVRSAQYVVSDLWHDSGDSGQPAQFSYQYSGNRLDLSGRGSLGFHSFVTLDRQTNLFKYQFLAQSFPMTGLTHRDETYRWLGGTGFNVISSHDNTVVFDKVSTGGGATLWPFISKAIETRWENGAGALSTVGSSVSSDPENLFTAGKPGGHHIQITAESRFDGATSTQTTLPSSVMSAGYNPSDFNGSANTVAGTTAFATFSGLPGAITHGNLTRLSTDFGDDFTETVVTTYKTGVALTGLVDTVTTTVTAPAPYNSETAPVKSYTYFTTPSGSLTPLVASETTDAVGTALDLTTTYTRDARGRVTNTQISSPDAAIGTYSVSSATAFNDTFDLPTTTRNAEPYLHTTTAAYHSFLGLPTSVTDVNSAQVTTEYDALGRAVKVRDVLKDLSTTSTFTADGTQSVSAPSGVTGITVTSAYKVTVTATAKPTVTTYYDRLGRPIRTIKDGFGTAQTVTDTAYNTLGQVVATSLPYPSGGTKYWATTTYDALGRVSTVTAPNSTVTTNTYFGRATQVSVNAPSLGGVDPAAQVNTTLVDAKGRTVKVWNADNVPSLSSAVTDIATPTPSIAFALDGFGRMRATTLKGQTQQITATYDALGRQTQLVDPDKGTWNYTNNALGQVVTQTDANANTTNSTFDRLGRPLTRTTTGNGATETADFHYYDASTVTTASQHTVAKGTPTAASPHAGWIGAPEREEATTTGSYPTVNTHYYDAKGRPSLELAKTDGKFFYTATSYDTYSRPHSVRHYWKPAGAELPTEQPYTWQDFGYVYTYDTESYLLSIADSFGRLWWDSPAYDHFDRVTSVRKGNGHTTTRTYRPEDGVLTNLNTGAIQAMTFGFDGLGNLTSRSDTGVSESFAYDALNRLEKRNGGIIAIYQTNGNIDSKTEVGGGTVTIGGYDTTRPHAVSSYTFGGQTLAITYDGNGNMLTRSGGGTTWSLKWAGFDKPRWMAKTGGGSTVGSEFHYNAGRSRVMQLEFDQMTGGAPSRYVRKRTYALGSTLELNYTTTTPALSPTWALDTVRIYVPGPDGIIGAREFRPASGGTEKSLVYHYDHLGSITAITDWGSTGGYSVASGNKSGRYSEDAWGQRRNPLTWSGTVPTTTDDGGSDSLTPRGFTGHEMLDDLGLVHMNGRIYDPLLGRFLSADIVVQSPASLQAFNRYSYVYNNPLSLTDPTGFFSGGNLGSMSPQPLATGLKASNYTNDQVEANLVLQQAIQAQAGSVTVGGTLVGASMVPVVGEIMDIIGWVTDPSSRQLYAASAMANAPTGGAYTPNASALRASERLQHAGAMRLDDAGRMLRQANQVERRLETAAVDPQRLSGIQFMTSAVEVAGKNATARGHSYEKKIAEMYEPHGFSKTDYKAASGASRQADAAGEAAGKAVAVEAKYVDSWDKSPANPDSAAAGMDFIKGGKMDDLVSQAKDLSQTFDKVIYHSNSQEFIDLYKKVFADAGFNNITFVLTSAAKK